MLVKKEDGTFYDTHESFNSEREEYLNSIGDEIIEEFEEWFKDNCTFSTDSDYSNECCPPGKYIEREDIPDYQKALEETIEEHYEDNMSDDDKDYLHDYVIDNVASEENLIESAEESYADWEPDYDDYGD